jgi:hypothetical protein
VIWVSWRQQRTETLIAGAIIAALAAVLVPTGIAMANAFDRDGLSACLGQNTSENCGSAIQSFLTRYRWLDNLTSWFTLVPGLIGVLLAASFVFELENGTYRLAWTQSITRRRWILTRLGTCIGAAVATAIAMTLLVTWWRTPIVDLNGRMESGVFDFEGTVAVGYVLFALGLALAVGAVWRRTVPALIVAFIGYVAARVFVDTWLRQRFQAPLEATWNPAGGGVQPHSLRHAWVIEQYPSDRLGQHVEVNLGLCARPGEGAARAIDKACFLQHAPDYLHAIYQPASRFWLFQGIETLLFGGTAILLIAFAAWWTHRRAT